MKPSRYAFVIVIIQRNSRFSTEQLIHLRITFIPLLFVVKPIPTSFINARVALLAPMDEKHYQHQRRQSSQEEEKKTNKGVRIGEIPGAKEPEPQGQVDEVRHKTEPQKSQSPKGSCLQRLPFGRSFWQDALIVYHWYNHMLVYMSCVLVGCGCQLVVIGTYQFIQVDRTLTIEAASLGLWIKLSSGCLLLLTAFSLLHGTCYSKVWLLYIVVVVAVLNLLCVISGGVVMKYETNSDRISDKLHAQMDKFFVDSSETIVHTVDRIQTEFTCCGVSGQSDYSASSQHPVSCCLNKTSPFYNNTDLDALFGPCASNDSAQINFDGCTTRFQDYRSSLVAPHYIFFVLAGLILLIGTGLTICFIPMAKRKTHVAAEDIDDQGLDDPFRRSLVAAAILGQIDDELLADEVFLPPPERETLERFRQRVAECHSMAGIHRIIDESADIIRIIKESSRRPDPGIPKSKQASRRSLLHDERENERLTVLMQGV